MAGLLSFRDLFSPSFVFKSKLFDTLLDVLPESDRLSHEVDVGNQFTDGQIQRTDLSVPVAFYWYWLIRS